MKTIKHTPGPWKYEGNKIISLSSWFIEPNPEYEPEGIPTTVVSLFGAMGGDNVEADAKLIAAAPDLLEALQDLLQIAENYKVEGPYMKKAYNVIKKATE